MKKLTTARALRPAAATALAGALLLAGCSTDQGTAADAETNTLPASSTTAAATDASAIDVSRADHRDSAAGDPDNFTSDVSVLPLFGPADDSDAGAGQVTFQPGARTAWHTHPIGQRLIITDGTGWIQQDGQDRITVTEGDVVWFPPGVKHWHGATSEEPMTHIAVQETVDDSNVTWMEPVTDDQYLDQP